MVGRKIIDLKNRIDGELAIHKGEIPKSAIKANYNMVRIVPESGYAHSSLGHFQIRSAPDVRSVAQLMPLEHANSFSNTGIGRTYRFWGKDLLISLGEKQHSKQVSVKLFGQNLFEFALYSDNSRLWHQIIGNDEDKEVGASSHRIDIPFNIARKGYDKILIYPIDGKGPFDIGDIVIHRS
jgi:hypothetical protein